jgi:hypothetical protein
LSLVRPPALIFAKMQSAIFYFGLTLAILAFAVVLILLISRRNVFAFAPVILIPPSFWAMVQWRCKISGGYACGHGLAGGLSWHFWAALAIFTLLFVVVATAFSWRQQTNLLEELGNLLFASRALTGLWAYVIWSEIPGPGMHPPRLGGTCPEIPLFCHDVPLANFGGGLWWTTPFLIITVFCIARYTFKSLQRIPAGC